MAVTLVTPENDILALRDEQVLHDVRQRLDRSRMQMDAFLFPTIIPVLAEGFR